MNSFVFQGPLVYIDTYYYGKMVIASLNIIRYNVFGKGGPDLYGKNLLAFALLFLLNLLKGELNVKTNLFWFESIGIVD